MACILLGRRQKILVSSESMLGKPLLREEAGAPGPPSGASGYAGARGPHATGDWHSLFDGLFPMLHQQPDSCGCCVELGHFVLVNDAPHSPDVRVGGDTFKLSRRQGSDTAIPYCYRPAAPSQAGGAESNREQQLDPSMSLQECQGHHAVKPAQSRDLSYCFLGMDLASPHPRCPSKCPPKHPSSTGTWVATSVTQSHQPK